MIRIGIDVGGTNTDAVVMDGTQVLAGVKAATTGDVMSGVVAALKAVLEAARLEPSAIDVVMIGTTHFTNAVVQRRDLAPTAAVRLGVPATASLPPMVDWPDDLKAAIGGHYYLAHGGHDGVDGDRGAVEVERLSRPAHGEHLDVVTRQQRGDLAGERRMTEDDGALDAAAQLRIAQQSAVAVDDVAAEAGAADDLGDQRPAARVRERLGGGAGIAVTRPWGREFRGLLETVATMGQTFPPVAVLALAVPVMGFGPEPALIALTLYALLPVVENTVAGLDGVPAPVLDSARGLGMGPAEVLFRVELPLAAPVILAGVRTAVIINVGTAAIASTVGAKTLGLPIIVGLNGSNQAYVIQGALIVAALAVVIDAGFDRLAGWLTRWSQC